MGVENVRGPEQPDRRRSVRVGVLDYVAGVPERVDPVIENRRFDVVSRGQRADADGLTAASTSRSSRSRSSPVPLT